MEDDDIKIETHEEPEEDCDSMGNWYKIYYAHKLVFLLPKECFENGLSISNQDTVSDKITKDLNQIISESDEYIKEVKFELKDEIDVTSYFKNKIMSAQTTSFWDKDCLRVFISYGGKNREIAKN